MIKRKLMLFLKILMQEQIGLLEFIQLEIKVIEDHVGLMELQKLLVIDFELLQIQK